MKRILASTFIALCSFSAMAQVENEPEKGFVISIYDTDGDFTNVRAGAGGAVVDKLKTGETYNFIISDGLSDQNGWVKIPNSVVYKYDDYGEGEPLSHFETKLKTSATGSTTRCFRCIALTLELQCTRSLPKVPPSATKYHIR